MHKSIEALNNAIAAYWRNTTVGYSVKTNSLPYLATRYNDCGFYAECVSEDEFNMVSLCGIPHGMTICNGPVKSKDFVFRILDGNAIINIDSNAEINHVSKYAHTHGYKQVKVGMRVNLDTTVFDKGCEPGRFGFCYENGSLKHAIEELQNNRVKISGLHLHSGNIHGCLEKYIWLIDKFHEIVNVYNLDDIEYIDLGGGFYGFMDNRPDWEQYFKAISARLKLHGYDRLKLIVEPGSSIMAGIFDYYTRVVDTKATTHSQYALCDGSRIHIDPLMHKNNYPHEIIHVSRYNGSLFERQIVAGFTCMECDRIMQLDNGEYATTGDIIKIEKVGSYCSTLSPLFISYFPFVYLLRSDGKLACLREKWTEKEFVQKCFY